VAISRSLTDSASSSTDASSYTFSAESLGTADSDRYILVGIAARAASARTISSVTIGGVSATILIDHSSSLSLAGFAIAAVPSGTTGDVVVTFSGTMVRCAIAVYRLLGLGSTTPTDTGTDGGVASLTTNLDINAGGAAFAVGHRAATGTPTWTNLTLDANIAVESNNSSFASDEFASAQTALAVTCAYSSNVTNVFAALSLAPVAGGTSYTITPSGGITLAGTGTEVHSKVFSPTGGVSFAGTGSMTFASGGTEYVITPSGGVTLGGTSDFIKSKFFIPSGGVVFGGEATIVRGQVWSPTGGVVFGGTGSMESNVTPPASLIKERTKVGVGT
jgi:hypothetical protein